MAPWQLFPPVVPQAGKGKGKFMGEQGGNYEGPAMSWAGNEIRGPASEGALGRRGSD